MERTVGTVLFDGRFWVAVIERFSGGGYSVARHVFGAEPTNAELLDWAARGLDCLRFGEGAPPLAEPERRISPKRQRREAREGRAPGRGLGHAREALEAIRVRRRAERAAARRAAREAEAQARRAERAEEARRRRRDR
jgi:hypothetical protein